MNKILLPSRLFLAPILLFALVFALFAPSIRYPLVGLDAYAYITQNRIVIQGLTPGNVRAAFSRSNITATMYMPLLWLSYMADVTLFGASADHPAPFHAVNVVLHALSAVLLYLLLRLIPAGRLALDPLSLRLPVTGRLRRLAGTALFARAMGMLTGSGVTLLVALDTARALLANRRLSARVRAATDAVLRGGALAPALQARHDFTPMLSRMVAVGETPGSLSDAFTEVARFHEMMLAVAIKRFGAAIELHRLGYRKVLVG